MTFGTATLVVLLVCLCYLSAEGGGGGVRRRSKIGVEQQQEQQQHFRNMIQKLAPFLEPGESPYKVEASSIHELLAKVESRIHVEAENVNARFQGLVTTAEMKRQALYHAAELRTAVVQAHRTKAEAKVELLEQKLQAAEASFDTAQHRADTIKGELIVSQSEKTRLDNEAFQSTQMITRTKMADLKVTLTNLKKQLAIIKGIRNMIKVFSSSNKSSFNPMELKAVAESVVDAEFDSTPLRPLRSAVPGLEGFEKKGGQ